MSNHPSLKVPAERITQLKEMAANMGGVNISECLAKLIEFAQREGLIDHAIPGVQINALSDGIAIKFDKDETRAFSIEEAGHLASAIRAYLSGDRSAKVESENFSLKGKGQGIAISIPANSQTPKVFDRGLSAEFARLIERAAPATA